MANFGPGFIALRGTPEQTAADGQGVQGLLRQGRRPQRPAATPWTTRAASFVFDPAGRVRLFVPYGGDAKTLAADLKQLLAAG